MRIAVLIAGVLAAVALAVGANLILLGYGETRHDRVGQLSPRAHLPAADRLPTPSPRSGAERPDD